MEFGLNIHDKYFDSFLRIIELMYAESAEELQKL